MQGWDGYRAADVARVNARYGFIIEPFAPLIAHAKVPDIASHDDRWSYAFAGAGAAEVHAVEACSAMIEQKTIFLKLISNNAQRSLMVIFTQSSTGLSRRTHSLTSLLCLGFCTTSWITMSCSRRLSC